jgi:hypothetical protein
MVMVITLDSMGRGPMRWWGDLEPTNATGEEGGGGPGRIGVFSVVINANVKGAGTKI